MSDVGSSPNRGVMIVLAYLWLLALVPLLVERQDPEVQWHAKHGIVLMIAELILLFGYIVMTSIVSLRDAGARMRAQPVPRVRVGRRPRPARRRHPEGRQRRAPDHSGAQRLREPPLAHWPLSWCACLVVERAAARPRIDPALSARARARRGAHRAAVPLHADVQPLRRNRDRARRSRQGRRESAAPDRALRTVDGSGTRDGP